MAESKLKNPSPSLLLDVPGFSGLAIILGFFSLMVNVLVLAMPIYTLQLFDRVLGSKSTDTLLLLTMAVGIALFVHVALDAVRGRILQRLSARFESYHTDTVLQASLLQSARNGEASAQPMRDLAEVKGAIGSPMATTLLDAPWVPFFLFTTFLLHPAIGYLTLVGMVTLFLIAAFHAWYVNRTHSELNTDAIHAFENMQDYADHADALVSMGMRDAVVSGWRQKAHKLLTRQIVLGQNSSAVQSLSKFIRMGLQVGVMGIGCYLVLKLELSPGAMIAASIIMARALAPAEQAIGSWKTFTSARDALARLKQVMTEHDLRRPHIPVASIRGDVSLDRVSFSRPGMTRPIIQPTNLSIAPGSTVGLIGPSGSGKSTLARLLVGVLAPTTGYVRIDGVDVTRRAAFDLGAHIGYLPQEVQLFHGPVSDNIARLDEAEPEAIRAAAELAGVDELINRLPDDYATVIGRTGVRLSGGQQQRIGLARALFGSPKVIVLDEPDASLDPDGIDKLLTALRAMQEAGSTIILISHRPPMLTMADRLILMRDGAIEADGPRDAVLQTMGIHIAGPAVKPPAQRPLLQKVVDNGGAESATDGAAETAQVNREDTLSAVAVRDWPAPIKEKWRRAYHQNKLPTDDEERRAFAVALGLWLSYTTRHGLGIDDWLSPSEAKAASVEIAARLSDLNATAPALLLPKMLRALDCFDAALSIEAVSEETASNASESA